MPRKHRLRACPPGDAMTVMRSRETSKGYMTSSNVRWLTIGLTDCEIKSTFGQSIAFNGFYMTTVS